MPIRLTMPKLSPTMESGTIVKWHKKEGDSVKMGDLLIEVATDKATVEYNAIDEGILRKILVSEGKEAIINQPIGILAESGAESIDAFIEQITKEQNKPAAQPAQQQLASQEGATPQVLEKRSGLSQPAFIPYPPKEEIEFVHPDQEGGIRASPYAKKLAKERNIDLRTVPGSGPHGRIIAKDLELGQKQAIAGFGIREIPQIPSGSYEHIPLSPMRKVIAERLQASKSFIPHFYVHVQVSVTKLIELREELKGYGHNFTYNDFILRACALALREFPTVNRGFDSEKNALIQFKTIDIAVAVSLPEGLITPIIRYADYLSLPQLSSSMKILSKKAKEGKLSSDEYMGGSFTVSNLGMTGIDSFEAIINPPQAGILAVGGISDVPSIQNGVLAAQKIMKLSLSVDHRVIDGMLAAQFLKRVQQLLENPSILIIG